MPSRPPEPLFDFNDFGFNKITHELDQDGLPTLFPNLAMFCRSALTEALGLAWQSLDSKQREQATAQAMRLHCASAPEIIHQASLKLGSIFGAAGSVACACALLSRQSSTGARAATGQGTSRFKEALCQDALATHAAKAPALWGFLCLAGACAAKDPERVAFLEKLGCAESLNLARSKGLVAVAFESACRDMLLGLDATRGPKKSQPALDCLNAFGRFGGAKMRSGTPPLRMALIAKAQIHAFESLLAHGADSFATSSLNPRACIEDMVKTPSLAGLATSLLQARELSRSTPHAPKAPLAKKPKTL
jgi:hypothetical protein